MQWHFMLWHFYIRQSLTLCCSQSRPQTTPTPYIPSPPSPCTPRPLLIRSSTVARHSGLVLHFTDTWQTIEWPFVRRDPPQITPKMHHAGICLFFCFFFFVYLMRARVCSVVAQRRARSHVSSFHAIQVNANDHQWQVASSLRLKERHRQLSTDRPDPQPTNTFYWHPCKEFKSYISSIVMSQMVTFIVLHMYFFKTIRRSPSLSAVALQF